MWNLLQTGLLIAIFWEVSGLRKPTRKQSPNKAIIDSCALIDGRIVELSSSGFLPGELIIPEFILHELQLLADGSDAHKRARARYGLDVAQELQAFMHVKVTIDREQINEKLLIDDKLVELAKKRGAMLYTTDFNLGKVAAIEKVKVLNVNEIASALRPIILPGEVRTVKIVQKGNSGDQGVAYLEDGTLLVIDHASRYIGKTVKVSITRMHQTVAGKMIFADIVSPKTPSKVNSRVTETLSQNLRKRSTH